MTKNKRFRNISKKVLALFNIGHELHEWTSYTAFNAIFKFFKEERSKLERSKH